MWFWIFRWPLQYNPNWPGFENSYRALAFLPEDVLLIDGREFGPTVSMVVKFLRENVNATCKN